MHDDVEASRLAKLMDLDVLDSAPEPLFDRYVTLAAEIFGVPVALISLVDADRQWFKARVGLAAQETSRGIAFCDHAIRSDETFVVLDAAADPRFRNNPLVTEAPHIRFYAGAPLTVMGHRLGTLCVIDFEAHPEFTGARQLECMAASVAQALVVRKAGIETSRVARTASDRLRLIQLMESASHIGAWTWERERDRMVWSDEVFRIHGRDPALAEPDMAGLLAAYPRGDAERLTAMVMEAMQDGCDRRFEAKLTRMDGTRVKATVTRRGGGDDGAVIGVLGSFQAID